MTNTELYLIYEASDQSGFIVYIKKTGETQHISTFTKLIEAFPSLKDVNLNIE